MPPARKCPPIFTNFWSLWALWLSDFHETLFSASSCASESPVKSSSLRGFIKCVKLWGENSAVLALGSTWQAYCRVMYRGITLIFAMEFIQSSPSTMPKKIWNISTCIPATSDFLKVVLFRLFSTTKWRKWKCTPYFIFDWLNRFWWFFVRSSYHPSTFNSYSIMNLHWPVFEQDAHLYGVRVAKSFINKAILLKT